MAMLLSLDEIPQPNIAWPLRATSIVKNRGLSPGGRLPRNYVELT